MHRIRMLKLFCISSILFVSATTLVWADNDLTLATEGQKQSATSEIGTKAKEASPGDAKVKSVAPSSEKKTNQKLESNCMTPVKKTAPMLDDGEVDKLIDHILDLSRQIQRKYSDADIDKARKESAREICKLNEVIDVRDSGGSIWVTIHDSREFSFEIPMTKARNESGALKL